MSEPTSTTAAVTGERIPARSTESEVTAMEWEATLNDFPLTGEPSSGRSIQQSGVSGSWKLI